MTDVKERIQQKAHDLFMHYGVRSVTMDEIALQLGISKKTIYHFFSDKDELVDEVMNLKIKCSEQNCLQDKERAKDPDHEMFLAIEMMQEMFETSEAMARELGKIESFDDEGARNLYRTIGLGALKYFMLKVDPKKNMLFNPAESVDFNGNTGPFIQYTYARIKSVLRKAEEAGYEVSVSDGNMVVLHPEEKELLRKLHDFPALVLQAAEMHSPAVIANYAFELASEYNRFYQEHTILKEKELQSRGLRLSLSQFTAKVIANALWMLGIEVPERM